MQALSPEWIERIFERLKAIYKQDWTSRHADKNHDIDVVTWQNGLAGVTADEIKHALNLCSQTAYSYSPTVVQFYHYAKDVRHPPQIEHNVQNEKSSSVIARKYLDEIKIKMRDVSHVPHRTMSKP